ncbi:hypothetical protein CMV30_03655 [Nibricoccus aquaticus]|uniref:TPM domain-containing protein n=1 Tax=Nibricoccus aquaticus TaxID=2576891 RepID=A0A290Q3W5_9BACT|nr:hypothetical protein [Nibricoccus aquaticus]ATC63123.1 hypothetical protein CMV30_03655 [Nibricoccus aquaticus]
MKLMLPLLPLILATACVQHVFSATPPTPPPPALSSAPSLPVYFDNSADVVPSDPAWSAALNEKLAAFKASHGITFIVRLHAKSPSAEEDKVPGAYMRTLAAKLGTVQSGVLAVYFADEDDWRLWIGDDLTARFSGKSGTPKELTKSGAIHDAKEALFATATAKRDTIFTALQKAAPADQPPLPARRTQLYADALVDELIKIFTNK